MDRATKIFNVLLSRASKIHRNFIIDQTNVYKNARKRKLKPFLDYIKIAVVVFPRAEELKLRAAKRFIEMGKEVPAEAVNEMIANYTLPMSKDMPMTNEYFDQVLFVELSREEAQRSLDEMKRQISVVCVPPLRENSLVSCSSSSLQNNQHAPIQSYGGASVQNRGVGYGYQSSYSSQPMSGTPHGSYYSSFSTHDSKHGFGYTGSSKGDDYMEWMTNESKSRALPTHRVINEFSQNFGINNPGRSNIAEPYHRTSSLSYNTYDNRYANTGGASCGPSALMHSAYESAAPLPYGTYGSQMSRPPHGSFPNDMQHSGALYPQPSPQRPPPTNLPTNLQPPYGSSPNFMQQAGVYPQLRPVPPLPPISPANLQRPGLYPRPSQGF
ncbi:hypothetical protein CDL12_22270 [Handroanthus impetiginosus]|uniref:Uncharacterized protein n=1 Tax=Handroanthus impetiginosus TaxID=429701 RepID=A0A2G9GIS6_9LAMI|nr:hypothetical protein CDL12_22270 [Handroanthus impetiginosus]